jgi:hypothetical protein
VTPAEPDTETFEYTVHHLLARYYVPRTVQATLAAEILAAARRQLGIDVTAPPGAKKERQFASGKAVHFFEGPDAVKSTCWRIPRTKLQEWRIFEDWNAFLAHEGHCLHCEHAHLSNIVAPRTT